MFPVSRIPLSFIRHNSSLDCNTEHNNETIEILYSLKHLWCDGREMILQLWLLLLLPFKFIRLLHPVGHRHHVILGANASSRKGGRGFAQLGEMGSFATRI
jgi:hypothetical protein